MGQKAKIVICAAYKNGFEIVSFVLSNNYSVDFIATCGQDNSPYKQLIAELCEQYGVKLVSNIDANSKIFIDQIISNGIDIVFLAWWPSIIKGDAINAAKIGWVNLHPSFLPYNRGKHPYYWSIVESTIFGVTLHFIDTGIDTGDVLFQRQIPILITDTGESLYSKADKECLDLFKTYFDKIVNLEFDRHRQDDNMATMHFAVDIEDNSNIDLNKTYKAIELINKIRARTFNHGASAYFYYDDKKYLIRVKIEETEI